MKRSEHLEIAGNLIEIGLFPGAYPQTGICSRIYLGTSRITHDGTGYFLLFGDCLEFEEIPFRIDFENRNFLSCRIPRGKFQRMLLLCGQRTGYGCMTCLGRSLSLGHLKIVPNQDDDLIFGITV